MSLPTNSNVSNFFETLVAASNLAAEPNRYQNPMVDSCLTTLHGNYATIGETLNFNFVAPNVSNCTNIGSGAISPVALSQTQVSIPLTTKASTSFNIPIFDQTRTIVDLAETFIAPKIEEVLRFIDADLTSLVTTSNFGSAVTVPGGATAGKFLRADLSAAWAQLAGAGTPMGRPQDEINFITNHTAYANMVADSTLSYQYIVGEPASQMAQQQAYLVNGMGARIRWSQNFPTISGKQVGLFFHNSAIAVRFAKERPIYGTGTGYIDETIVFPRENMPVKIQLWGDPTNQANLVHISCCYARAALRSERAAYLITG